MTDHPEDPWLAVESARWLPDLELRRRLERLKVKREKPVMSDEDIRRAVLELHPEVVSRSPHEGGIVCKPIGSRSA